MKHCKSSDSLIVSDAVKHKSKDFVRKYMSKYGPFYRPEDKDDPEMCRDNSFSPNSDIATSRFQATYVPTIQSNESNEMRSDSAGQ